MPPLSLVQAALPPFPVMLATRVAEGLSHLGIVVAAPTLIGTLAPPARRGAAMTLWGTFFGVAFAVTALAGVPLVRAHGLGALFLAHGAFAALVGAALWALLPQGDPCGDHAPAASAEASPFGWRALARRHAAAYGSARVAAPAAGWLFYTLTFVALLTVLPALVPPGERAFVAAAMPLASIAVSMTLGVALLRRMEAVSVTVWGFAASIAIALAFAAAPGGTWLPVALLGALGLGAGGELRGHPGTQRRARGAGARQWRGGADGQLGQRGRHAAPAGRARRSWLQDDDRPRDRLLARRPGGPPAAAGTTTRRVSLRRAAMERLRESFVRFTKAESDF